MTQVTEDKAWAGTQSNGVATTDFLAPKILDNKVLTEKEFKQFRELFFDLSGITLTANKKHLVTGRLSCRLRHYGLANFNDYFTLATRAGNETEKQRLLDLLTTNETYFFREPMHFEFLRTEILPNYPREYPLRLWSAASSSGEEAYSIAMVLADFLSCSSTWSILGTDINAEVLHRAQQAKYSIEIKEYIPERYLNKYCLKGFGQEAGKLLIDRSLRSHVDFKKFNLNNSTWSGLEQFDVIFIRNVMIYFDVKTKQELVNKTVRQLKPGGYLITGLSETIRDCSDRFERIKPSIYRFLG
jgi:chemotaxis protein methyltransferase CheR